MFDIIENNINYEILKPLYYMLVDKTRESSKMRWGLYNGDLQWCPPKIWYDNRVSVIVRNGKFIIKYTVSSRKSFYGYIDLADIDCYEKTIYWLSMHMPIILKLKKSLILAGGL